MADISSYLGQLPSKYSQVLLALFKSGATLTNSITGNVTGNVTGSVTGNTVVLSQAGGTTGLSITGTYATGISVTGACSTAALSIVQTSAVATAVNIVAATIGMTLTGASSVNTAEILRSVLTSNVRVGNWANAILGKIDFSTAGYVTGLAGVVCAELDMANGAIGAGSYCCFEGELNIPTSGSGYAASVPVAFLTGNAWGAGVAAWRSGGYVFNFTGLGNAASSNILQANTDQPTHAIRILIDGTPYFMLMTTANNGTE